MVFMKTDKVVCTVYTKNTGTGHLIPKLWSHAQLGPKSIWSHTLFGPKSIWSQTLFGPKSIWSRALFGPKSIDNRRGESGGVPLLQLLWKHQAGSQIFFAAFFIQNFY